MFTVIGLMFSGILLGYLLRVKRMTQLNKVITCLIWALLFLLGVEVGGNRRIIEGLATLGMEAIVITLASVLGSRIAAWALWVVLYRRKRKEV